MSRLICIYMLGLLCDYFTRTDQPDVSAVPDSYEIVPEFDVSVYSSTDSDQVFILNSNSQHLPHDT